MVIALNEGVAVHKITIVAAVRVGLVLMLKPVNNFLISLLMLLIASCVTQQSRKNDKRSVTLTVDNSIKLTAEQKKCRKDEDCVTTANGCCSCNMGGSAIAVNKWSKKSLEQAVARQCDVFCVAFISDHSSCSARPICRNSVCILSTGKNN